MVFSTLGLLILLLIVVFHKTLLQMASTWSNNEDFSHGWLIVPISIWLFWRRKAELINLNPEASWWGVLAFAGFAAAWFAGDAVGVSAVRGYAWVGMLISAVISILGLGFFKRFAFELLFLFAMVPAGEGLVPLLIEPTADVTVWLIQLSGIPVYRDGLNFVLPTGSWSVVEACSGLRYTIAAAILGALFAYLNYSSWRRRIIFFVACIVLSLVANWIRAYTVVLVGHFSGMKYGTGDDHIYYGWVFFGLVMFAIFALGLRFRDDVALPEVYPAEVSANQTSPNLKVISGVAGGLALIALIAYQLPEWLANFGADQASTANLDSLQLRKVAPNQRTKELEQLPIIPAFKGAKQEFFKVIEGQGGVWLARFDQQRKTVDMLAYGQGLVEPNSKEVIVYRTQVVAVQGGSVLLSDISVKGLRVQALTGYVSNGRITHSPTRSKIDRFIQMLQGKGDASWVIVSFGETQDKALTNARPILEAVGRISP